MQAQPCHSVGFGWRGGAHLGTRTGHPGRAAVWWARGPVPPVATQVFCCLWVRQSPQEGQSSNESSRLGSTRAPHTVPATHLWLFGWGQPSPESRHVSRNVPPLPLPSGVPVATCPTRACWDMPAERAGPPLLATAGLWWPAQASAASVPSWDFCSHTGF